MRKLLLNPTPLFRKLRQLSMLLTLLLVPLGALGQTITVAGLTPDELGAIAGANISGTVSFDSKTNTLTLTNATINGDIAWSNSGENLTIQMSGKNTVNGDITATVTCSLHIKKIDNAESATLKHTGNREIFDPVTTLNNAEFTYNSTNYHYYTTAAVYELMVGGIQVHNIEGELGYKDNIFQDNGTPTATFDGTNKITLNGATLTNFIHWANNTDLTIELIDANSITRDGFCIDYEGSGTTVPHISFTAGGTAGSECSLELSTGTATDESVITGFSNADAPTMGTGLYWIPTSTSATITNSILGGGSGTAADPFIIKTADDFKNFAQYVNNKIIGSGVCVKLSDEISESGLDCSSLAGFQPIGIEGDELINFTGTFDGNEKSITGLSITGVEGENVGLFRCLDGGTITQLTLDGCTISGGTSSSDNIGGIVGYVSSGTVSNCIVQNSTISCNDNSQNPNVGGIVGALVGGEITGCVFQNSFVKAEPSASSGGINSYAGGIAGNAASGTISNCQVKGTAEISAICSTQITYSGAIAGNRISVTLLNNTYDYSVITKVQSSDITELTTYSGYTERGIGGSTSGSGSSDEKGKVELAGTKTVTINVPDVVGNGGCNAVEGTYYKFVEPNYYVLSGSNFTYSMKPTNSSYKPAFTLSDNTIEVTTDEIEEDNIYDHTEFTFTMPDANLTPTLSFLRDISSDSYTATIEDATYTGAAQTSQAVSLSLNDGAITPFTLDIHYTIEGYKDADKQALESAPKNVGTYYATIKGVEANGFTGSKDVQFNITKANLNIVTIEAIPNQTYSGSEIEPEITVTLNDEEVAAEDNFTIAYSNNTNVSSATVRGTVTLTALATSECFTEGTTKIATFVIIPKSIEGVTVTLSGDGFDSEKNCFVYNGQNQTPTVTVKDGERLLTLDTDYTLSNNGGVGVADDYAVTVTGKGNYRGDTSIDVTYSITPKSIVDVSISDIADQLYSGSAIEPEVTVKDGETELTLNTDYTVSYSNNTNAAASTAENAPTITITGKGNYDETTTATATFTIAKASLADAGITQITVGETNYSTAEDINIPYTGSAIQPTATIKYNDGTVTLDASEYTLTYENNTELGEATVTATATGKNFTAGTVTSTTFNIVAANVEITAPDQTVVYNGNKQAYTKATVNNENAKLSITYYATAEDRTNGTNALAEAPTNADTYYIRVTQTDEHYTAEAKDATFTIEQLNITGAVITLDKTVLTYNETEQTVEVTEVKVGEIVVPATSYEVSGNVQTLAGEHTVTVTAKPNGDAFKNNFKGSATTTFTIKDRTAEINFASGLSYMTYYKSDENFLIPDGVTAYIITGVGESTVTVTKVSYLKAGTALLLEKTAGSTIEKNPDESFDENKLVYADADVATTGNEYVLYKNEFVKATQTITQGKCYLNLTGAAPSRGMYGIDNDGSTAINSASLNDNEEMINDNWYDLQGHRIAKPTKAGLYIKNGKKMVINNK